MDIFYWCAWPLSYPHEWSTSWSNIIVTSFKRGDYWHGIYKFNTFYTSKHVEEPTVRLYLLSFCSCFITGKRDKHKIRTIYESVCVCVGGIISLKAHLVCKYAKAATKDSFEYNIEMQREKRKKAHEVLLSLVISLSIHIHYIILEKNVTFKKAISLDG